MIVPLKIFKIYPHHHRKYHHNKLLDLKFQYLNPSSFALQQKNRKGPSFIKAISFAETLIYSSTKSLPFEKHCIDLESFPLNIEHQHSFSHFVHHRTWDSGSVDIDLTVVFNEVRNINTYIIFSEPILSKNVCIPH